MIKWRFVTEITPSLRPVASGVFRALLGGFDRIAARPFLILPPLLLDLFLWLGPQIRLTALFAFLASRLWPPTDASADLVEQLALVREMLSGFGAQFNLISSASTFPIGVPSLMAATMPVATPVGAPSVLEVSEPLTILAAWLGLTVFGLTLALLYHGALARVAAPNAAGGGFTRPWMTILAMAAAAYLGVGVILLASLLAASLVSLITPFLGTGVAFLGFTVLFWLGVYLAFTPHGVVRYRLGLLPAMRESVTIVRTSFFPTIGFLAVVVLISWLSGMVWQMPQPESWFSLLAVLGHAFVSAMLLTASYVFYVGRRQALLAPGGGSGMDRRDLRGA